MEHTIEQVGELLDKVSVLRKMEVELRESVGKNGEETRWKRLEVERRIAKIGNDVGWSWMRWGMGDEKEYTIKYGEYVKDQENIRKEIELELESDWRDIDLV